MWSSIKLIDLTQLRHRNNNVILLISYLNKYSDRLGHVTKQVFLMQLFRFDNFEIYEIYKKR